VYEEETGCLSIFIFGIYVIFLGITFLFVPEIMFLMLAYPTPKILYLVSTHASSSYYIPWRFRRIAASESSCHHVRCY